MKRYRYDRLPATIAVTTLAFLGATGCGGSTKKTHSETSPTAPTTVAQPPAPKPDIAKQAANEVRQINVQAFLAARQILKGLGQPGVNATNYSSSHPEIFGNADHSGGTHIPETFASYDSRAREVRLESISEIDHDASGAPTLGEAFTFRLRPGNILAKKRGQRLSLQDYERALARPEQISLVQSGATTSRNDGYGVNIGTRSLTVDTGYGAEDGGLNQHEIPLVPPQATLQTNAGELQQAEQKYSAVIRRVTEHLYAEFLPNFKG